MIMDISIVTVTHNSKSTIAEQIRSVILSCEGIEYEQVVVDNGSTDGTLDIINEQFPLVRVIRNHANQGFGRANNQGVEVTIAPFILFLNPDMKFTETGAIKRWVEWLKSRPDVGISGCKLTRPDGELNLDATPRRFPKVWEMLAIFLKIPHLFPSILDKYLYRCRNFGEEQVVDSVRGSCLLMRRELIDQLGFAFDQRYFIWFEDVDTCREAKRLGWQVLYTPIVSCVDYVGQAFKKKPLLWKQWEFSRSAAEYFTKWLFH